MSDTTLPTTHGSKLAILIPLLSAVLLIAFLIFFGSESPKYTQSLREFDPHEGQFYRVEGTASDLQMDGIYRLAQLCTEGQCIWIAVSPEQPIAPNDVVIAEGIWKSNRLMVSRLLRRCDGHPF